MTQADDLKLGYELLCMYARNIAMLPLEEWDENLESAETVAPILDPTLYRDYLYSDKAKIIRKLIKAAIALKREVLEAQPLVKKEMRGEKVP